MTTVSNNFAAAAYLRQGGGDQSPRSSVDSSSRNSSGTDQSAGATGNAGGVAPEDVIDLSDRVKQAVGAAAERIASGSAPKRTSRLDPDEFLKQFHAFFDRLSATLRAESANYKEPAPYAVITDAGGNEVGQIRQSGAVFLSGDRNIGLLSLTASLKGTENDDKYGRYEAFKNGLGGGYKIALTGIDVEPPAIDRTASNKVLDEFHSFISAYRL